ncbi:MAG: PQQ-binding-like beta-propeller repeat protein [Sandaracinaceae bacterium]
MDSYRESAAEDRSILIVGFNGYLMGLSAREGTILWEQRLEGWGTLEVLIHRASRVYVTNGHELVCLDYGTGVPLHRVKVPDSYKGRATTVIEGDRLYLASGGEVTCFSLACEPLWTQGFKGRGIGEVALGFRGNFRQADERGSK